MVYGIAGNTSKEEIWDPIASLLQWLRSQELPYSLHADVAAGLRARIPKLHLAVTPEKAPDIILSFGGDGTLLRTAHHVAQTGTPILGINLGRLGFLAEVDIADVREAIKLLEAGAYQVEPRLALSVATGAAQTAVQWALNDVVVARAESAGLVAISVTADGVALDTYWADGLIVATPTGSTAYSLAAGGPIVAPGTDALLVTPIASHSLTVRPVVLSGNSVIDIQVAEASLPCVLAVDGTSRAMSDGSLIRIQRASHTVRLVRLAGRNYFHTLRSKLSWGAGPQQRTK